jgi:hypothetical protein
MTVSEEDKSKTGSTVEVLEYRYIFSANLGQEYQQFVGVDLSNWDLELETPCVHFFAALSGSALSSMPATIRNTP